MSYAVRIERGNARIIHTGTGATVRTVPGPFTAGVAQGDEAHLTQKGGRIRIVNIRTGATIRVV
jgi:hypothetical protein